MAHLNMTDSLSQCPVGLEFKQLITRTSASEILAVVDVSMLSEPFGLTYSQVYCVDMFVDICLIQ